MNSPMETLLSYIHNQRRFEGVPSPAYGCDHLGAIIAEAVLQPGSRFKTSVVPCIERILRQYPRAKTSSGFVRILEEISPKYTLNWEEDDKPRRVLATAKYLHGAGIETTDEFRLVLADPEYAKSLKEIRGIGNKHIDYLKLSIDLPCESLPDSIHRFLQEAGLAFPTLDEAQPILEHTAQELKLDIRQFQLSVWRYVSNQ
jgi:hypothetical protein